MKGILLVVDLEGCTKKYDHKNVHLSKNHTEEDVRLVIDQLKTAGHQNIAILDCHDSGHNLSGIRSAFPEIPQYSQVWNMVAWHKYDSAFLIGFHARSGIADFYSHTLRSEVDKMILGNKVIGEIEWLINTLAFYGIETKGVSAVGGAREEVESLGIPFFSTISVRDHNVDHEKKCREYRDFIKESLEKKGIKYKYNNSHLEIVFSCNGIIEAFPPDLFSRTEKGLIFDNTIDFVSKSYGMCKYLNARRDYRRSIIYHIRNICRSYFTPETLASTSDAKFYQLYRNTMVDELSTNDLLFIRSALEARIERENYD